MSTIVSLKLRRKKNKNGLFPITIRITKDRRTSYISLGKNIEEKYWDSSRLRVRKAHPNSTQLNSFLQTKLAEVNKKLLEVQSEEKFFTSDSVKEAYLGKQRKLGFKEFSNRHLRYLKDNQKYSQLRTERAKFKHFISYLKGSDIDFKEIDVALLNKYSTYLLSEKKLSERTVINYLISIRTLYNKAISEGLTDRNLYPFGKNKIRLRFPETEKIGLTPLEVKRLEKALNLTESESHSRNIWLFSFYFAGIRIGDVLQIRWCDIYDGRLHYRMDKNSKVVSLQVPEKVGAILNKYSSINNRRDDYIFPELRGFGQSKETIHNRIRSVNKRLNKALNRAAMKAGINKKISMHTARHTFGHIAGDKIPIQILQKLYRHSSINTTMIYQSNFITSKTDEALNKVINF